MANDSDTLVVDVDLVVVGIVVVVNVNAEFIELFVTNFGIEFLSLGTLSLCLAI